jgi:hypothetical protein
MVSLASCLRSHGNVSEWFRVGTTWGGPDAKIYKTEEASQFEIACGEFIRLVWTSKDILKNKKTTREVV